MEMLVRPDGEGVAQEAAERVVLAASSAIAGRGRFRWALSGGSTPAALYALLASPAYRDRIDWSHVEIFFGDERCVPPDHEWSNYRVARTSLLDQVEIVPKNVNRIQGELSPDQGAASYAKTLVQAFGDDGSRPPRFDLILLGMGDDGHTASLFPGMPALEEQRAWVVGTLVPDTVRPRVPRVTLTLPVLNAAHEVLFLVVGQGKAERVKQVVAAEQPAQGQDRQLPAALVQPGNGRLTWLVDEAAASRLERG